MRAGARRAASGRRRPIHAAWAATVLAALATPPAAAAAQDAEHPGKPVYDKWCAGCHGVDGTGNGVAAGRMLPRPRDFTQALYQIRTTGSGQIPTDADILHVIDVGMPGTAMPGWERQLTSRQRQDLVGYLKTFSRFFETEGTPEPLDFGRAPGASEERVAEGRELYERLECWKCHGQSGRGNGSSAPTQEDDNGDPIRPADLSENWYFNGGGTVEDIYRRFRTGMDGTPMPSFSDIIDAGVATEDELWSLAHYVRSLSPEETPEPAEVVRAVRMEDGLPAAVDDSAWADVPRFYVPLVGQIIQEPRWFSPTVDGVFVQAAHDGEEVAVRLSWHDPSRSPAPVWSDWQRRVAAFMEPREGEEASTGALPDRLIMQFPATMPEERDLPFFLGGDARSPVYLWGWTSDEGAGEATGRGFTQMEALQGGALEGEAVFQDGEWRLLLRRPLEVEGESRIQMEEGAAIPFALFAWDGNNAETGKRGSVSSWYYLWLDQPVAATVYTLPVIAAVITALLLLLAVSRARKGERAHVAHPEAQTIPEGA